MAGLLTCGSWLPHLPGASAPVAFGARSPLTVAGAVTDLAPDSYTAPCSLLIRGSSETRKTMIKYEHTSGALAIAKTFR